MNRPDTRLIWAPRVLRDWLETQAGQQSSTTDRKALMWFVAAWDGDDAAEEVERYRRALEWISTSNPAATESQIICALRALGTLEEAP